MSEQVNIEQVREALEASIYRDDLPPVEIVDRCVNVVSLHTRQMSDELEALKDFKNYIDTYLGTHIYENYTEWAKK
jgi:hypothetical protein